MSCKTAFRTFIKFWFTGFGIMLVCNIYVLDSTHNSKNKICKSLRAIGLLEPVSKPMGHGTKQPQGWT